MKTVFVFFAMVLLWGAPVVHLRATVPQTGSAGTTSVAVSHLPDHSIAIKKMGIKKSGILKAVGKRWLGRQDEVVKPSKLAKFALLLFIFSFSAISLSIISLVFPVLFAAGFLTSNVLAIIVLAKEDNPKSRKLARLIIMVSVFMIIAVGMLIAMLLHYFPNQ